MKLAKLFIPAVVGGLFTFTVGYPMAASATGPKSQPMCQDLTGWDMSQTRSAGHFKVTPVGLKVWTDDATSNAKVAGYTAPAEGTNLSNIGTPAINWVGTSPAPGLQIVVDLPGGGPSEGILVGESVYGNNWWLTSGSSAAMKAVDPSGANNGGNGSEWFGTLAEWNTALEGKGWVRSVGFSLGSGVKGEGFIKSLTFHGKKYTFPCVAPTKSPTATPTATPSATATPTATATATPSGTTTPSATVTPSATGTPSTTPTPGGGVATTSINPEPVGNNTGALPVTGTSLWGVVAGGVALLAVGMGLLVWAWRRRDASFEA